MMSWVTIGVALVVVVAALFGVSAVMEGCGNMVIHFALGMVHECPKTLLAGAVHHLDALLMALLALFATLIVARIVFRRLTCVSVVSAQTRLSPIAVRSYEGRCRNAIAVVYPRRMFRCGIIHRKDAPELIASAAFSFR